MLENFRTLTIPYTLIAGKTAIAPAFIEPDKSSVLYHTSTPWVRLENIVLIQNPSETLNADIYFVKSGQCDVTGNYLYRVNTWLNFQNNLHEFNQNYVYEVICECSEGVKQPAERLFRFFERRTGLCTTILQKHCSTSQLIENESLLFYIRRCHVDFYKNETEQCIDYKWLHQEVPANVKLYVDGETILVHKFLLTHKSEVFKAMFTNKRTEACTVRIGDFSVDVIKEMVNFMYTGQASNVEEMCYQLYKAAHKYKLYDLCFCCVEHMLFNFNFANIAKNLELACLYDIEELKESALNFVRNHPQEMSEEPSYQDYMCRTMNVDNVVDKLLFARLYGIDKVSRKAFDFIGQNYSKMKDNRNFNKLFQSDPILMKEIFHYYCKQYVGKVSN